jgi:hypothetical protein
MREADLGALKESLPVIEICIGDKLAGVVLVMAELNRETTGTLNGSHLFMGS